MKQWLMHSTPEAGVPRKVGSRTCSELRAWLRRETSDRLRRRSRMFSSSRLQTAFALLRTQTLSAGRLSSSRAHSGTVSSSMGSHQNPSRMNGLGLENEFPRKILFYAPSIYRIVPLSEEIKASAGDGKGFVDITTVAFDRASGIRMATGDVAGSIRIYTLNNAPEVLKSLGADGSEKGKPKKVVQLTVSRSVQTLSGHQEAITSLNFDINGKRLVSGSKDGTSRIWDVGSGKELCLLPTTSGLPPAYTKNKTLLKQMCRASLFSPDGLKVFTLQNAARGASYVTVWALEEGESLGFKPARVGRVSEVPVPCMGLSPDGTRLCLGDVRGSVHVVASDSLRQLSSYEAHQLPASCIDVAASGSGKSGLAECSIITGSGDKTLIFGTAYPAATSPVLLSLAFVLVLLSFFVLSGTSENLCFFSCTDIGA
mmetsp:Transcript_28583/g.63811  ORF Transcript_28583/g.63811 Transcript_28583/m.63811 type:complete len:427 (-) Transcript_28583:138-1418(-)